jgi:uncharacterized protein involved in exopolysaccharide biosynthesis
MRSLSSSSAAGWAWTIRRNIRIVTSRPQLFAAVVVVALIATFGFDHFYPRTYSSTAQLLTEPGSVKVPPFDTSSGPLVNELEFMQTQVEIVKSGTVLKPVVDSEDLTNHIGELSTPLDELSRQADRFAIWAHLKEAPDPATARIAMAIDLLRSRTAATPVKDSFLLQISVSTRNPKLSQRIANALVRSYGDATGASKLRQLKASEQVLAQQLTEADKRVVQANQKLADFTAANKSYVSSTSTTSGIAGITANPTTNVTTLPDPKRAELAQLEWVLTEERNRYQVMQAQLDTVHNQQAALRGQVSLTDVLDAPLVNLTPDGPNLKLRLLAYLALAPLLGIAACYLAHYLEVYRRSVDLMVVSRA